VLAEVARCVADRFRRGTLIAGLEAQPSAVLIGLGHSMGALLCLIAEAHHGPFDALTLLGWSGRGLPEMLSPDEAAFAGRADDLREAIADLALARFGDLLPPLATGEANTAASDHLIAVPVENLARQALSAAATPMLTQAGLWAMIPGSHDLERTSIEVPVFCGVGEFDITGDPAELPGYLPKASVDVFVLPEAGHNANIASGRAKLWDGVLRWCLERAG